MARYGLTGAFLIEVLTFGAALCITSAVTLPVSERSAEGLIGSGQVWSETAAAWRYIRARPGLVGLLVLLANGHFTSGMVSPLRDIANTAP